MQVTNITIDTRVAPTPVAEGAPRRFADNMSGRDFAVSRRQILVEELGFTDQEAWKISNASGPGRAVQAADWVLQVVETEQEWDALSMVVSGALDAGNYTGWVRKANAFTLMGFELPTDALGSSMGLHKFLAGVRSALFTQHVRNHCTREEVLN